MAEESTSISLEEVFEPPADVLELSRQYVEVWQKKQEIEAQVKALNETLERLDKQLTELYGANKITSMTVAGRTLYLRESVRVSLADSEKREEAIAVFQEAGFDDLITLNWQKLTPRMKEFMGEELDEAKLPEVVRPYLAVFRETKIGNTKAGR